MLAWKFGVRQHQSLRALCDLRVRKIEIGALFFYYSNLDIVRISKKVERSPNALHLFQAICA
jgi:hypothetical protein